MTIYIFYFLTLGVSGFVWGCQGVCWFGGKEETAGSRQWHSSLSLEVNVCLVTAEKIDSCVRGGCIYCTEKVVCIDSACHYMLCPKIIL